jgi:predicted transcriptional regulator
VRRVVGSSESEELVRFVATARSRRPESWGYVERLKAACAQMPGRNPEPNDLLRRVRHLEHEVETLRAQSKTLQAQLAQVVQTVPKGICANRSMAVNAGTYADSDEA